MTEQEIIKYIKDEIENETDTYHWFDNTPKNKTRLQIEESINAHQGLLDLYTNAKTKINKQEKAIDRMAERICNNIEDLQFFNNSKEGVKEYFMNMEDK